ncbi:MAG TPA: hypothetical protein VIK47_05025 [Kiloniellales bacterium]
MTGHAAGAVAAVGRGKHFDPKLITLDCMHAVRAALSGEHSVVLAPEVNARPRAAAEH